MGAQIDERVSIHCGAALAMEAITAKAFGIPTEVDLIHALKLSPHFVGGNSEHPGIRKPKAVTVDPVLPPIRIQLQSSCPRRKLDNEIVRLPSGTSASHFLLEILGVTSPATAGPHEEECLESSRYWLLGEVLNASGGGGMDETPPTTTAAAAFVENVQNPPDSDKSQQNGEADVSPADHGPIVSE